MISTPAEALYPNVQIHLVLGVGGGVGGGHDKAHPLKLYTQMCKFIWFWGMISTPAEALYPNVQIHLVLGVGGGVGVGGMISTPAELLHQQGCAKSNQFVLGGWVGGDDKHTR